MNQLMEYKVVDDDKKTHRIIQWVNGKRHPMHEAIIQWGESLCESCDRLLANENQVIKIGHQCQSCKTPVIGFMPMSWKEDVFTVDWGDGETFTPAERMYIRKLGELMLELDPEGTIKIRVEPMTYDDAMRTAMGVTGHLRVVANELRGNGMSMAEQQRSNDFWKVFYSRHWPDLDHEAAVGVGFLAMVVQEIERK